MIRRGRVFAALAGVLCSLAMAVCAPAWAETATPPAVVRLVYFYATSCPHCQAIIDEVLDPLQAQHGAQLEMKRLDIGAPASYELLVKAEERFGVPADRRALPTLVIGGQVLIGEAPIRDNLEALIRAGLQSGGIDWPDIPGLEASGQSKGFGAPGLPALPAAGGDEGCKVEQTAGDGCETAAPIWAAYFYQVGCQECSRAEADLDYLRQRYPQLVVEEFNIYDHAALAQWLAQRAGREGFHTPALAVGDRLLIGAEEITPAGLAALMERYAATGAEKVWASFDPHAGLAGVIDRFRSFGPLTVIAAGLVDGLNPCAFATLIFFVSYLTLSGRKGREVLLVGGAFAAGVFLAYLLIGLGIYKVLDLLGGALTTLGRWVYLLTAVLCAALAAISVLDFVKARRGKIGDMSLRLPEPLRVKINAVIRKQRNARDYAAGAFFAGLAISFLELACTGQIYLPTLIFVSSVPELRLQAIAFLLLYNAMFILPLIVVFILAYFGTTSKDLTVFLHKRAAAVKLGMAVVFASLAVWLGASLLV
jgi:cytochrome c biogenesis protein CcdA/glutaredoxin